MARLAAVGSSDVGSILGAAKPRAPVSTGPKTPQGKLRSSLNAIKHGLAGMHLLLPGEDRAEYERRADAIFVALDPKDDAQAQLVALAADDMWKLERLSKIEQGVALGRIEELLAQTPTAEKAGATTNALTMLGSALTRWVEQPIPTERSTEFERRFRAVTDALDFVGSAVTEVPADFVEACDPFITALRGERDATVPVDAYRGLYQAASMVMAKLLEHGDRVDDAQDDLRRAIATIAVPDKDELAKIAKYRRMLEDGLLRRLQALEQLRKLGSTGARSEEEKAASRGYRVQLRVVA